MMGKHLLIAFPIPLFFFKIRAMQIGGDTLGCSDTKQSQSFRGRE